MSNIFHFKKFIINQTISAMKVGTDSVLLGSLVTCSDAQRILDIGTGTGLLALMMAQKCEGLVDAVEIDKDAAQEAAYNFSNSQWNNRLHVTHSSFESFVESGKAKYDLLISNPPYYRKNANIDITDEKRAKARHDKDLPFENLISGVTRCMIEKGRFWLILPTNEAKEFVALCKVKSLFLVKETRIRSKPSKEPNRVVMCFCNEEAKLHSHEFTLYGENGKATTEYMRLTKDYLLWENSTYSGS